VAAPHVFGHQKSTVTTGSGREQWTTMAGQASNHARGEKGPGGPADHPEALERLREAQGGVTASRSCGEATVGLGGDCGAPCAPPVELKQRRMRRRWRSSSAPHRRSSWSSKGDKEEA
jgi:hypothetical protein